MKYKADLMWSIFTSSVGGFLGKYKSKIVGPYLQHMSDPLQNFDFLIILSPDTGGSCSYSESDLQENVSHVGNKSMLSFIGRYLQFVFVLLLFTQDDNYGHGTVFVACYLEVASQYKRLILKWNCKFDVNKTLSATIWVTLYCKSSQLHMMLAASWTGWKGSSSGSYGTSGMMLMSNSSTILLSCSSSCCSLFVPNTRSSNWASKRSGMACCSKSGSFLPSTESDLRARVTVLVEAAPPGLPGLQLPPNLSLARASSSSRSISAKRPLRAAFSARASSLLCRSRAFSSLRAGFSSRRIFSSSSFFWRHLLVAAFLLLANFLYSSSVEKSFMADLRLRGALFIPFFPFFPLPGTPSTLSLNNRSLTSVDAILVI